MVGKDRDALVFTNRRGDVPRNSNWRARVFAPAVAACQKACATFPMITPHDLRHTAASLAISAGANVKAAQRMLGHAKASMTLDVYAICSTRIWTRSGRTGQRDSAQREPAGVYDVILGLRPFPARSTAGQPQSCGIQTSIIPPGRPPLPTSFEMAGDRLGAWSTRRMASHSASNF